MVKLVRHSLKKWWFNFQGIHLFIVWFDNFTYIYIHIYIYMCVWMYLHLWPTPSQFRQQQIAFVPPIDMYKDWGISDMLPKAQVFKEISHCR